MTSRSIRLKIRRNSVRAVSTSFAFVVHASCRKHEGYQKLKGYTHSLEGSFVVLIEEDERAVGRCCGKRRTPAGRSVPRLKRGETVLGGMLVAGRIPNGVFICV